MNLHNDVPSTKIAYDALLALVEKPMQDFLHPTLGDEKIHRQYMASLGRGDSGLPQSPCPTLPAHGRPQLSFDEKDYEAAYERCGANCGPGALAAILGIHIDQAVHVLPQFMKYGFTTEVMMAVSLARFGQKFDWSPADPDLDVNKWPELGLVRIAFEGEWTQAGNRMEDLLRSHWVASYMPGNGQMEIFDINAIRSSGWMSHLSWRDGLIPWIAENLVEGANGAWHVVETIAIHRKQPTWH